jgi:hypothetical protein
VDVINCHLAGAFTTNNGAIEHRAGDTMAGPCDAAISEDEGTVERQAVGGTNDRHAADVSGRHPEEVTAKEDEAERRAADGIASLRAGAKSADECAVKRYAPGSSSHCCVEAEGGSADDAVKHLAVDGIARP